MVEYSAGIVTAYGSAKRAGYTGSYEDFCRQQAQYAQNASAVEQAKQTAVSASQSADQAKQDAQTASTQAQLADQSAQGSAQLAGQSAVDAQTAETNAQTYAQSAQGSAQSASASAGSAQQSAQVAQGVLESIPEDYSDLSSDVVQLKADLQNETTAIYNCVKNITYTLSRGFIGGTGAVTNPGSTTQEVYTSKIPVTMGDTIGINLTWGASNTQWVAIVYYDSEEAFISRTTLYSATGSSYSTTHTIPNDVNYIVMTYRTYGNATLALTRSWGELSQVVAAIVPNVVTNEFAYHLPSNTVRSIAHRGDAVNAPQCTAPAYIIARKRGFTIAENDLWLSSDNEFVMWHDTSLSRLGTNLFDINGYYMYTDGTDYYWYDSDNTTLYTYDSTNGYVESAVDVGTLTQCKGADYSVTDLTLAVLKRLDFGAYKGSRFAGTQIMTFEEWVLLCKQLGMEIYIDRKLTYTDELLTQAANIIKRLGMGDKTTWLGIASVVRVNFLRNLIDGARVGILAHPTEALAEAFANCNTGRGFIFDGNGATATAEAIQVGLNAGYEVECYYVDNTGVSESDQLSRIRELVGYGVTGLTLDHYMIEDAFKYLLDQY